MVCAIHSLKRELRKHAFEHTKMPFLEFRGQILRWIDDKQNQYMLTVTKTRKQQVVCYFIHKNR